MQLDVASLNSAFQEDVDCSALTDEGRSQGVLKEASRAGELLKPAFTHLP
jgi:hypothetical protein